MDSYYKVLKYDLLKLQAEYEKKFKKAGKNREKICDLNQEYGIKITYIEEDLKSYNRMKRKELEDKLKTQTIMLWLQNIDTCKNKRHTV